jgi:c-di-GMP-binding flagellar brake protein YcgR
MVEKRRARRRHIIYYLRVFDRKTNQLVGQLVDITTSGMKLVSENTIEPDTCFELRMVLPEEIDKKKEITFAVKSMWCKRDVNPNFFSIGFEFEDISTEDISIIKNLIYDFSFRD